MSNKNKRNKGIVYSTNPDFQYSSGATPTANTLEAGKQNLRMVYEKKGRAGKPVTIIIGFVGKNEDLEALGRTLKTKCGTGGSVKDGEIIIQGDMRLRLKSILENMKYKVQ